MRTPRRRRHRSLTATAAATAAIAALSTSAVAPALASDQPPVNIVEMTPELTKKMQHEVDTFFAKHDLPGLSVAVVTPARAGSDPVITTFVAGTPTLGSSELVDATTQFELGSETKVFTADLLAYLVATDRVSLDDPVQLFAPAGVEVPEWTDPQTGATTAITLGDLATHQAGLLDAPPNLGAGCGADPGCENPRPGYTQTMLWDAFAQPCLNGQPCPMYQPGTDWLYSDWGFGLLGTILANVLDPVIETEPPAYQSALDQAFLDALGMSSTELEFHGDGRLATPYKADGTNAFHWDNTNAISGAGGLISDATDMGTWVAAHLGYVPSTAPIGVQAMADTLQPISDITMSCSIPDQCGPAHFQMGLGWELHHAATHDVGAAWAFKNGLTDGSSTDTALAPSLRVGVTTMYNKRLSDTDQGLPLAITLLKLLVADQPAPEPAPSAAPQAALAESGQPTAELIVPGMMAAGFVAIGLLLIIRRRGHGRRSTR
ncbi:serine hydrolase domain-containing protein [Agromyces fucosus]|nr:serine hydrolase domain-containing protein [Agromyces fucosus]